MTDGAPTLLCVDDDPEILEMLADYLAHQGFRVVTATNGVEALFQVTRHTPKAVILDLFMPRLGGLGALDRIRRLDPGIVVILISGVPNALEMVTEAGVSVAGALTKPLDPAQLLGTLVQAGVVPPKAPAAAPPQERPAEARHLAPRRAMVVDDDPEFRGVLAEYLRAKGFETLEAEGGEEALRRLPEVRPHIVLLDVAMPGLSGVEILRRIKAMHLGTSVIMVSGIEDVETARRTLAMGAVDYVAKPVDYRYLDSVLEMHLLMARMDLGTK